MAGRERDGERKTGARPQRPPTATATTTATPHSARSCHFNAPLFTISVVNSRTFLISRFSFSCDCGNATPINTSRRCMCVSHSTPSGTPSNYATGPHLLQRSVQLLVLQSKPLQALVTHQLRDHLQHHSHSHGQSHHGRCNSVRVTHAAGRRRRCAVCSVRCECAPPGSLSPAVPAVSLRMCRQAPRACPSPHPVASQRGQGQRRQWRRTRARNTVHASSSGGRLTAHTHARRSGTRPATQPSLPFATAATYGHRCRSHGDSTGPSTLAGTADTPADPREHTHTRTNTGASEQCTGNSTSA